MAEAPATKRLWKLLGNVLVAILALVVSGDALTGESRAADGLRISNRLSPKNARRPLRPETRFIVLHTTEGAQAGSLDKVRRRGETHYFVTTGGTVFRIIDRARIATHAGRSMWDALRNIDNYAIGIEVVGNYNRDITEAQYAALRELLRQLKSVYRLPDDRVLTHSMVAYGRPNRFQRSDHRGRKRCGMVFARPDVRRKLGLTAGPDRDPDVDAGRLVVADRLLYNSLFTRGRPGAVAASPPPAESPVPAAEEASAISRDQTAWYIAREKYDSPTTTYILPDGKRLRGDEIEDWSTLPQGTRVLVGEEEDESLADLFREIGRDGNTARDLAGDAFDRATTIYFFRDGLVRTGRDLSTAGQTRTLLDRLPAGTRVLVGYVYGGYVKSSRPPSSIAGVKWNYPSTFYRFPNGRIVSGDGIDDSGIPVRTLIFYQN